MNERQLKVFYEVATCLSMTEAAARIYMTQPAVSQVIKDLEQKYEVKFFDRINNKLHLTSNGEMFLSYARRILNLLNDFEQTIKEAKNLKKGTLKVGASPTIGIYILPEILGEFKKLNPEIDVSIVIENTRTIANFVLENKIDFAFVEGPVYSNEIILQEICDDELVIITSPEHPWSKRGVIDVEDIKGQSIVLREPMTGSRESFENLLNRYNMELDVKFELGNAEAVKKAVEANLGISCISKRAIQREVTDKRLAVINLENNKILRKFHLICHKDKHISPLFMTFIEFFEKNIKNP